MFGVVIFLSDALSVFVATLTFSSTVDIASVVFSTLWVSFVVTVSTRWELSLIFSGVTAVEGASAGAKLSFGIETLASERTISEFEEVTLSDTTPLSLVILAVESETATCSSAWAVCTPESRKTPKRTEAAPKEYLRIEKRWATW